MRRMITKNGIIDAVNEGIESGEIEAGGLPEFDQYDTNKVLTVIPDPDVPNAAIASWEPGIPAYGEAQEGNVLGIEADPETGDLQPGWITPAAGGGHCYLFLFVNGDQPYGYGFKYFTDTDLVITDIGTALKSLSTDLNNKGLNTKNDTYPIEAMNYWTYSNHQVELRQIYGIRSFGDYIAFCGSVMTWRYDSDGNMTNIFLPSSTTVMDLLSPITPAWFKSVSKLY